MVNVIFFVDVFFLFDFTYVALESRETIRQQLAGLDYCNRMVEEISSLAIIRYDNPDWCFPHLQMQTISCGSEYGSSLRPSDVRVCNNLKINGMAMFY
jgi:hypothetical protein